MQDQLIAFLIIVVFTCGAAMSAAITSYYWRRRRNFEADATWSRYVETERQRTNMRHDLEAARIRTATLEAERDTAAYQLTQLAAVATVATQQAQVGRAFTLNEGVLDRICRN